MARLVKWGLKGYYFNSWNKPIYNKDIFREDFLLQTKAIEKDILGLLKSSSTGDLEG